MRCPKWTTVWTDPIIRFPFFVFLVSQSFFLCPQSHEKLQKSAEISQITRRPVHQKVRGSGRECCRVVRSNNEKVDDKPGNANRVVAVDELAVSRGGGRAAGPQRAARRPPLGVEAAPQVLGHAALAVGPPEPCPPAPARALHLGDRQASVPARAPSTPSAHVHQRRHR